MELALKWLLNNLKNQQSDEKIYDDVDGTLSKSKIKHSNLQYGHC